MRKKKQIHPDLSHLDDESLRELLRSLPKTDLHCHLDGSLRLQTIAELACERDIIVLAREYGYPLPSHDSAEKLRKLLVPRRPRQLKTYLKAFDLTCAVLQTPESLERAAYELALDAAAENVRYLEVRFAPLRHSNRLMDGARAIKSVNDGLERAEKRTRGRITTGIIICAMRNFGRELSPYYASLAQMHPHCTPKELAQLVCLETARLAVRCREQGMPRIVGFDLAGAERNHPPHHYTQAFYQIINALMNITVHAGEAYGPESVRQAVCYLGANRIGHGTRLVGKQAQKLVDYIRDHRILVEVCLTSNLQTKAVSHLSRHPFKEFLDSEVRVTLCTDNRLISDTTVTNELFLATRAYNLNAHDVRRTILYGFKGAFLPYDKRRKLLLEARAELRTLGLRSEDGYH